MDDVFKKIVQTMNETVLKDINFNEKNQENVRQTIHNRNKKSFHVKHKLNYFLPTVITLLFFLGTSYFIINELKILSREEKITGLNKNNEAILQEPKIDPHLYTPPEQKESYKEMTKKDVVAKLLNTVDYFHTASGKFEEYSLFYDDSVSTSIIEYKLSLKNEIGGYEKVTTLFDEKVMGFKESIQEYIYNNEKLWSKESLNKTYQVQDYQSEPTREVVTPEEAFSIKLKDVYKKNTKFRERPQITASGTSLFPYEITSSYLRNMEHWEIEKQNEELLGHNTIVLFGKIDEQVVERMKMKGTTDTFRFWVDKDTGILMKYETYDKDGKLTSYLHPERLDVNIPIDPQTFVPNLDGYHLPINTRKKVNIDPREVDIEVVDYADDIKEDTEDVLDLLRKDIPFLYEFTHSKLSLFSAGYEKYKAYKQAYLTYIFENESQVIYVRAYHKDSVIRTLSDFNREKGEQLEKFTLNGIEWSGYDITDLLGAHFIGMKGDYKYEVVSQDISLQDTKELLKSFKPNNDHQKQ